MSAQALVACAGRGHMDSSCLEQFTTSQQLSLLPEIRAVFLLWNFAAPVPVLCDMRALLVAGEVQVCTAKSVPFVWAVM